jgi:hypothetical protein
VDRAPFTSERPRAQTDERDAPFSIGGKGLDCRRSGVNSSGFRADGAVWLSGGATCRVGAEHFHQLIVETEDQEGRCPLSDKRARVLCCR